MAKARGEALGRGGAADVAGADEQQTHVEPPAVDGERQNSGPPASPPGRGNALTILTAGNAWLARNHAINYGKSM